MCACLCARGCVCARGRARAISRGGHLRGWGRGRHLPARQAHLALTLSVGLVTVGIKAFADGTVARSAHGVPPPAFGARKVNPVGETGQQREGVRHCPQGQRKMLEARSLTWPASGPLPPPGVASVSPLLVPSLTHPTSLTLRIPDSRGRLSGRLLPLNLLLK